MAFDMAEVFFTWVWGFIPGVLVGMALAILVARIENTKLGGDQTGHCP